MVFSILVSVPGPPVDGHLTQIRRQKPYVGRQGHSDLASASPLTSLCVSLPAPANLGSQNRSCTHPPRAGKRPSAWTPFLYTAVSLHLLPRLLASYLHSGQPGPLHQILFTSLPALYFL